MAVDCFKFLHIFFNIIFTIAGMVLVGIGIWTAADKIYLSSVIGDSLFSAVSYLVIVVGVVMMVVCIFGVYAVIKEDLKLVVIYLGALLLAFVLILVTAIIAVVFKAEVESAMVDEMRKTLINGYGSDSDVNDAWDKIQSELKCCAISQELIGGGSSHYRGPYVDGTVPETPAERNAQDAWAIYKRTEWFRKQNDLESSDKKYVPKSCCIYKADEYLSLSYCQNFASGPPTVYKNGLTNHHLYYDGCYQKAKAVIMDHTDILMALGFVFAFIMVGGVVLTLFVYRRIKVNNNEAAKRRRQPDNL